MSRLRYTQDQRLRPLERLRHPDEYQRVFSQGTKLIAPTFILYVLPGSQPWSRLGMAVSKRVGKAVVRNRVKRRIRELFRQHKSHFAFPCDVVFVARRRAAGASFREYTQQFLMLLHRYTAGKRREVTGIADGDFTASS